MRLQEFGPPEVLRPVDSPAPVPGPGQVLIDVQISNVTFVETQVRAGTAPFPVSLPMVPGNGVGGTVASVGPGADPALLGRLVVSTSGGSGGYAEQVAVVATGPIPVPDGVSLDDAVALLADGRTATMLMGAVDLRPGERVLVEAAAGGVGTLLVQLASNAGATVVAAAGGPRKLAVARDLGADVLVDYRRPGWTERVRDVVGEVDVVLDGVGGDVARSAFELLRLGGRMLSFGLASGTWAEVSAEQAAERGITLLQAARPSPDVLRELTASALSEAAAGRLRPVIGQRFPLERAADAHRAIESRRTIGKTLLDVR
jgi:NADPH2:quinone reductase